MRSCFPFTLAASLALAATVHAEVRLPAIFSDNMVLQRDQPNPVWGWADGGEAVTVEFAGQVHRTEASADGDWRVVLDPLPGSFEPRELVVRGGNELRFGNVLVGEVWLCSGQSNMQWEVRQSDDADLVIPVADYPAIRIITVPRVGTQEPQRDFEGAWQAVTPETVGDFSAIGYFFGQLLHRHLDVPVGLIDNAWGGSACEAWIPRDRLDQLPAATPYMEEWREREATFDYQEELAKWRERMDAWEAEAESGRAPNPPRRPRNEMTGQHRPANLYNGVLYPLIGYGMRGVIWYQGENNSGRAAAYREVFPLMIETWRELWGQGDFPFYWVQLANFDRDKPAAVGDPSAWAELREAQTMTLDRLENVGQAVIIDAGEGRDIHPRDKQVVARRLARIALARDYRVDVPYLNPRFESMEVVGNEVTLQFRDTGERLYGFGSSRLEGFTICGEDRVFVPANARVTGDDASQVRVWADEVADPVAVRYCWADNPEGNVYRRDGYVTLPATPFRTDDFPMVTAGK